MRNWRWWLAGSAIVVIAVLGSVLDVMEVDAAQYAEISREVSAGGGWLQIHWRDTDYLDKPPLLFWLSALSFKLFGVHNWSYKLPSILAAFLGVYATFRLARLFHPVEIARLAGLMFTSSAAFLLMTNDVRCDTLLTAAITSAIWLGAEYLRHHRWDHLVGCSVAIAAGMLAKGPIGIVAPVLALGLPVIFRRDRSVLRDARLLLAPLIIAVLLLPMCIGLHAQHGMQGLRFYFWEQSFGRITGDSPWQDTSTVLFFTHEVLWQLLPWTLFALVGLFLDLRTWIRQGAAQLPELITICGSISVFIALSLSRYKLPHYIYPILPLLCIVGARMLLGSLPAWIRAVQGGLLFGMVAAISWLLAVAFPDGRWPWLGLIVPVLLLALILWIRSRDVIWSSFSIMAMCGIVLNAHAYPHMLQFQANAKAGQWVTAHAIPEGRFAGFITGGHALDFYARRVVPWPPTLNDVRGMLQPGVVIYADAARLEELRSIGVEPDSVITFEHFPVQSLDLRFLDPSRRPGVIGHRYLVLY